MWINNQRRSGQATHILYSLFSFSLPAAIRKKRPSPVNQMPQIGIQCIVTQLYMDTCVAYVGLLANGGAVVTPGGMKHVLKMLRSHVQLTVCVKMKEVQRCCVSEGRNEEECWSLQQSQGLLLLLLLLLCEHYSCPPGGAGTEDTNVTLGWRLESSRTTSRAEKVQVCAAHKLNT